MKTLNDKLLDIIFKRQGIAVHAANWTAIQVDKMYEEAWNSFVLKGNYKLFRTVLDRVVSFIDAQMLATYNRTWYDTWESSILAQPKAYVEAQMVYKVLREGRTPAPKEEPEEPTQSPAIDPQDIEDDLPSGRTVPGYKTIQQPGSIESPRGAKGIPRYPGPKVSFARGLYNPPSVSYIRSIIKPEEIRKIINDEGKDIYEAIIRGVANGESTYDIAKEIRSKTMRSRASATRIARTEIHRVNVRAQEHSLRAALGKSIQAWQYVATLDQRTRPHHASRDGKIYNENDPRPVLPDGPNCRCVYIPTTKSFTELGVPELEGLLGPAGRSSMSGNQPTETYYPSWFNKQSTSVKTEILGASNYSKLSSKGKVTWEKFQSMPRSPTKRPAEDVKAGAHSRKARKA